MDLGSDLYNNYLNGDNSALEQLVEQFGDGLVRFAYCFVRDSAVAEDIMEEAFATLVFKRKAFKQQSLFKAYLYKITRNKAIDYLRYHRRFTPLDDLENVLSVESAEKTACKNELYEQVYRSLQQLPIQYRDVLTTVYLEGFSVGEVARIMGKSTKQVYNLLARAKLAMKEVMNNK